MTGVPLTFAGLGKPASNPAETHAGPPSAAATPEQAPV